MSSIHFSATYDDIALRQGIARSNMTIANWTKEINRNSQQVDTTFRQMHDALLKYATAGFAAKLGSEIIKVRGEFQQLGIAFETMLGSKAKADQLMQEAITFAQKTPFTLTDIATNVKQLMAMGIATEDVMTTMKALGDVAAGVSVPISRVAINYGQVAVLGKLQAREVRDFAMAGIPLTEELAKNMGKTKDQIAEMVTAGSIGFKDVEKAFQSMSSEGGKFFNLMEKQNASVTGQISNLTDKIQVMLNSIGKSNEGLIYSGISGVSMLITHYQDVIDILKVLAVTYGTYKAALLAVAAAQKIAALADYVQIFRLYQKELGFAETAQLAFNGAVRANPYVLALTGITAIISALVIFSKKAKTTEDIIKDLNNAISSMSKQVEVDSMISKYESLKSKINKTKEEQSDLNDTIQYLSNLFPDSIKKVDQYGKAIDLVTDKLITNNEALRKQIELQNQSIINETQDALNKKIEKQKKLLGELESGYKTLDLIGSGYSGSYGTSTGIATPSKMSAEEIKKTRNELSKLSTEIEQLAGKLSEDQKKLYDLGLVDAAKILEPYKDLFKNVSEYTTEELYNTKAKLVELLGSGLGSIAETKIKKQFAEITAQLGLPDIEKQINDTVSAITEAESKLKEMRKGSSTATKGEIDDQEQKVKALKSDLEILTGVRKKDLENQKKSEEELWEIKHKQLELEEAISKVIRDRINLSTEKMSKQTWKDPETGVITTGSAKPDTITHAATQKISQSLMTIMKLKTTSSEIERIWNNIEDKLKDPQSWDAISSGLGDLSGAFQGINNNASELMAKMSKVAKSVSSLIANVASGNLIAAAASGLSIILGLMEDQEQERIDKAQNLTNELEREADVLERQLALLDAINGTDKLSAMSTGDSFINKSIRENAYKLASVTPYEDPSAGGHRGDPTSTKPSDWSKVDFENISQKDLDKLIDYQYLKITSAEAQGKSTEAFESELGFLLEIDRLLKVKQDRIDQINKEITGTTADSITDEITRGFENGLDSVQDFADTTKGIIKKALIETFKTKFLVDQLSAWYTDFAEAAKSGGEITQSESDDLMGKINLIVEGATQGWDTMQQFITDAGLGDLLGGTTPSGLTGSIQNLTEQTGGELAGLMRKSSDDTRSIRDYTKMGIDHLVGIEINTYQTVLELQTAVIRLDQIVINTKPSLSGRDLGT